MRRTSETDALWLVCLSAFSIMLTNIWVSSSRSPWMRTAGVNSVEIVFPRSSATEILGYRTIGGGEIGKQFTKINLGKLRPPSAGFYLSDPQQIGRAHV